MGDKRDSFLVCNHPATNFLPLTEARREGIRLDRQTTTNQSAYIPATQQWKSSSPDPLFL